MLKVLEEELIAKHMKTVVEVRNISCEILVKVPFESYLRFKLCGK